MKLRERRYADNPRLMVIPMIDIIFFLLVFFMMSTLFMVEQKVLPIVLPAAEAAQVDTARTIAVSMLPDGSIVVGADSVVKTELADKIKNELTKDPEARFVLRADRNIPFGQVVEVLDKLRGAGVSRISVAVERSP